ncbi:MAG TPA: nucleotide exchange factor GrpE [Bacteroidetes bacterium]|nr:nucleotide exchange factor GrpE [Bacteroidota bacterium]
MTKINKEQEKKNKIEEKENRGEQKKILEQKQHTESEKQAEEKQHTKKKHISYKAKYEEVQDRYLRLSAEFDNYRKRTLREKADLTKFASEGVLLSLLPVIDDFDRAMASLPGHEECKSYVEGISLIYNKIKDFLKQNGVEEMKVLHQTFDPDLHDAVTKIPAQEDDLKGKIVDVLQKGYFLKGKVLRHAKVVIGE